METSKSAQFLYKITHCITRDGLLKDEKVINSSQNAKFSFFLHSNQISISERQSLEYCPNCLTVLIPGVNLQMRCIFSKRLKKAKKNSKDVLKRKYRERKLRFFCLSCQSHVDFELSKPQDKELKPKIELPNDFNPSNNLEKKTQTQNAKNRAKNRKKNSLLNLINNKKQQQEDSKKKSGLLSLDEFMKH